MLVQNSDDLFDVLLDVVGILYLGWLLWSARKAFPVRASMFDLRRSSWPTSEAVITRAKLMPRGKAFSFWTSRYPYPFYVWFEHEIWRREIRRCLHGSSLGF
jgi:hypothetical protein